VSRGNIFRDKITGASLVNLDLSLRSGNPQVVFKFIKGGIDLLAGAEIFEMSTVATNYPFVCRLMGYRLPEPVQYSVLGR
jgi:hypothetical protein